MKKVYAVEWNNNEAYEDHAWGVWCVCMTREKAEEMAARLNEEVERVDGEIYRLSNEGKWQEADALERPYMDRMYYFHLAMVKFDVREYELVE